MGGWTQDAHVARDGMPPTRRTVQELCGLWAAERIVGCGLWQRGTGRGIRAEASGGKGNRELCVQPAASGKRKDEFCGPASGPGEEIQEMCRS